jgi:DNA polymerase
MRVVALPRIGTVAAWRHQARALAKAGVAPEAVAWQVGQTDAAEDLFASADPVALMRPTTLRLPRDAINSIETALCHRDPQRFVRAYDIVLRLADGRLKWGDRSYPALGRLLLQEKAVRRDIHKMHAFVRFREAGRPDAARRAFVAWFEPDHLINEAAAPFFARRFGDMDWVIATPDLTARFEDGQLAFEVTAPAFHPPPDATEALWQTYFAHVFNPARLMVSAMTSEMPRKYWKNLPEAVLIPDMIRTAQTRSRRMQDAAPTLPPAHAERLRPRRPDLPDADPLTLETMKPALDACRRCPIGGCATQGVAGEGTAEARLMIVGEQPGDMEDLAGRPFVGPAGAVLDRAAAAAGLDRREVYLTNAVKHFKFTPRGKRRLHQRPNLSEVVQCRWWLDLEHKLVRPRGILALGATAALSLTGSGENLSRRRGTVEAARDGTPVLIAYHPSYILRLPNARVRAEAEASLVHDLAAAMEL